MDLIGKKVKHAKFGEGIITSQEATYVCVKFESEAETKKFVYPTCFKTFLKLLDATTAAEADATVRQQEEQERKKNNRKWKQQKLDALQKECRRVIPNPLKPLCFVPFRLLQPFATNTSGQPFPKLCT